MKRKSFIFQKLPILESPGKPYEDCPCDFNVASVHRDDFDPFSSSPAFIKTSAFNVLTGVEGYLKNVAETGTVHIVTKVDHGWICQQVTALSVARVDKDAGGIVTADNVYHFLNAKDEHAKEAS